MAIQYLNTNINIILISAMLQSQLSFLLIMLIWIVTYNNVKTAYVFDKTDFFDTNFCPYIAVMSGHSVNTCTFSNPQVNIHRANIALCELKKASGTYVKYSTTLTNPNGAPNTAFTIDMYVTTESTLSVKISFFIIVIKQQVIPFMDTLISNVLIGSQLNNNQATYRTHINNFLISATKFSSTANLKFIPFVTDFKIDSSSTVRFNFNVNVINDTAFNTVLGVYSLSNLQTFSGFLLIIDKSAMDFNISNDPNFGYAYNTYILSTTAGTSMNLTVLLPNYGPSFGHKCFFGLYDLAYNNLSDIQFTVKYSSGGNWSDLDQVITDSYIAWQGYYFCVGYNFICGEGDKYIDKIIKQCFAQLACPLMIPNGWNTATYICPSCINQMCNICDPSSRITCSSCISGTNSILNTTSNDCDCAAGYMPVVVTLSPTTVIWQGSIQYTKQCQINCTYFLPGCLIAGCMTPTYCTNCNAPTYYTKNLNPISMTINSCELCSIPLTGCNMCSDYDACIVCDTGYYLNAGFNNTNNRNYGNCQDCGTIPSCLECSSRLACTKCATGSTLMASGLCQCDPVVNGLLNCTTCSYTTKCDVCITDLYVSSVDHLCHPCSDISDCLHCNVQNHCTACNISYALKSIGPQVLCFLCNSSIPHCQICSSLAVCTSCALGYGIDVSSYCQTCAFLMETGCIRCLDNTACLECDPSHIQFQSHCLLCSIEISNCDICTNLTLPLLRCSTCNSSYYLTTGTISPATNDTCTLCSLAISHCLTCINETVCTVCQLPNMIGPTNICDKCVKGLYYAGGQCLNQTGCISTLKLKNGTYICLACQTALNYVFNTLTSHCACDIGYKQKIRSGLDPFCIPICGDGIKIQGQQQCDDKNTIDNDGCSAICTQQDDFVCLGSPSICILYTNFITSQFNYAYRYEGQNKGLFSFSLLPPARGLERMNWSKIVSLSLPNSSFSSISYSYSPSSGQLRVTFNYLKTLQTLSVSLNITFDPSMVISVPTQQKINFQILGINAPLIFQDTSLLSTYQTVNTITYVVSALIMLQFYVGSFVHKMIGLETLQICQIFYFARMLIDDKSSSILNSLNMLKYSNGYTNPDLLFGSTEVGSSVGTEKLSSVSSQFLTINLQKYFIHNVNFALIPLIIAIFVYVIYLRRKINQRNKYIQINQKDIKDKYTLLKRSTRRVYERFVFPYAMGLNFIVFGSTVLYFQSAQTKSSLTIGSAFSSVSYPVHLSIIFLVTAIYCHEVFLSLQNYRKQNAPQDQTKAVTMLQELQHDENNQEKQNHHSIYVLIYLLFNLVCISSILIATFISNFKYGLQILFISCICYFLIICYWKPYHSSINVHNHILKLNYGLTLVFLMICELFNRMDSMSATMQLTLVYVIISILFVIVIGGYVRVFLEIRFRKQLEQNSDALKPKDNQQQIPLKNLPKQKVSKNLVNNPFAFQYILNQAKDKYKMQGKIPQSMQPQNEHLIEQIKKQTYFKYHKNNKKQQTYQQKDQLDSYRQLKYKMKRQWDAIYEKTQKFN